MDPLFEQTGTPYQYTYQNPINLIDPNGKQTLTGSIAKKALGETAGGIIGTILDTPTTVVGALLHSTELSKGEQTFLDKQHAGVLEQAIANSNSSKNKITLYRGVSAEGVTSTQQIMYEQAKFGVAIPNGRRDFRWLGGHTDMGNHAMGDNLSIWTSWTASEEQARLFGGGPMGTGGIIMKKEFDRSHIILNTSNIAILMQEGEWLVPGIVTGAQVKRIKADENGNVFYNDRSKEKYVNPPLIE